MFKKIAVVVLISGVTIASFAQTGAGAPTTLPAKTAAPVAASATPAVSEQKAEAPKPVKHAKHHHHKKAAAKADTPAAPVK